MNPLQCIEITTGASVSASVIWLHGLGADGHDFEPIVPELRLPPSLAIRFVFPHAPHRPVTINGGMSMRAWYDITPEGRAFRGNDNHICESADQLRDLIAREQERGIATERIVLAGFSQGGAIALHTGLRYELSLAGIMALSTYLPMPARLHGELAAANRATSIFMAHGEQDMTIPVGWARQSLELMQSADLPVEWHHYMMGHSVCMEEIADISNWLQNVLIV